MTVFHRRRAYRNNRGQSRNCIQSALRPRLSQYLLSNICNIRRRPFDTSGGREPARYLCESGPRIKARSGSLTTFWMVAGSLWPRSTATQQPIACGRRKTAGSPHPRIVSPCQVQQGLILARRSSRFRQFMRVMPSVARDGHAAPVRYSHSAERGP